MKFLIIVLIAIFLTACAAQSGYQQFYTSYVDVKTLEVEQLVEGQEPQIFGTDNFERDTYILASKRYIAVGHSSFNGAYEDTKNAIAQARHVGATLVLVSSQYTDTQTRTATLFMPNNKTTYHSGTGTANTTHNSVNDGYLGSSNTNTTYHGASTTYGTRAVPITTHQRRYDQNAIYFVKSTKKLKVGINLRNLNPSQRVELERNTGAFIDVVMEGGPAFYSNVLPGDVLIEIDTRQVKNAPHAIEIISSIDAEAKVTEFVVIRKGAHKSIKVGL